MPRAQKADPAYTAWGALDWSHAPVKRTEGWAGRCVHCGRNALLYHPLTNKPTHKTCQDRIDAGA